MMRYPPIHAKTNFDGRFCDTLENCGLIDQLNELYDKNDGADLPSYCGPWPAKPYWMRFATHVSHASGMLLDDACDPCD